VAEVDGEALGAQAAVSAAVVEASEVEAEDMGVVMPDMAVATMLHEALHEAAFGDEAADTLLTEPTAAGRSSSIIAGARDPAVSFQIIRVLRGHTNSVDHELIRRSDLDWWWTAACSQAR